jgi:hypothetical protein
LKDSINHFASFATFQTTETTIVISAIFKLLNADKHGTVWLSQLQKE